MTLPFLAAKTRLPTCVPSLVARPRLVAALNLGLQPGAQLTLVAAPAGAGKTTLLVQWLRQIPADFRVGWLALDEGDNSLGRFFSYLLAALPGLEGDFAALAESNPNFSVEQAVAYLVERVADVEQNLLLVLDDYHVITTPEILQVLNC